MRRERSSRHGEPVVDGGDVMHAEYARPALVAEHAGGDGAVHAPGDVAAGEAADERLARGAEHDRPADRGDLVEAAQQLEVVLERLAEADPGVQLHALL